MGNSRSCIPMKIVLNDGATIVQGEYPDTGDHARGVYSGYKEAADLVQSDWLYWGDSVAWTSI